MASCFIASRAGRTRRYFSDEKSPTGQDEFVDASCAQFRKNRSRSSPLSWLLFPRPAKVASVRTYWSVGYGTSVRSTVFLRGAGGFSKSNSKLFSYDERSPSLRPLVKLPVLPSKTAAVTIHEERTQPNQALLYRLSGDYNPLHSDPEVAKIAGFPRPILHGLCTLGFAVRAVVKHFCSGDPDLVQSIQGRFMLHVFPGETLVTRMWREDNIERINFICNVKERSRPVLSGVVSLQPSPRL
ncbi:hypothetical protein L7F22_037323 [Adiantum nelumboides]|nr:hypothetical protein [Adiantum nelumboides]